MRGDRLKALREQSGHTQESLAELLGRDIKQVWRWETGKVTPSSDVIVQLAKVFQVSADFLLGLTDQPNQILGVKFNKGELDFINLYRRLSIRDQVMIAILADAMVDDDDISKLLKPDKPTKPENRD